MGDTVPTPSSASPFTLQGEKLEQALQIIRDEIERKVGILIIELDPMRRDDLSIFRPYVLNMKLSRSE
jgi:hypothetical protein